MLPAEASAPFVQYGDHRAVTICSKWNRQELFLISAVRCGIRETMLYSNQSQFVWEIAKMSITVNQIAEKCGVSRTTVLRALNGRGSVHKETREKILAVAKEYNYRPNLLARSLNHGRTMSLGVVTINVENMYFVQSLNIINKEADKKGYFTNIVVCDENLEWEKKLIQGLADRQMEGLLISPINKGKEFEEFLLSLNIPIVCIGNRVSDFITTVQVNEMEAAMDAVELIVSKGYQRIVFVCPPLALAEEQNIYSHEQRLLGFQLAVKKYPKLKSKVIGGGDYLARVSHMVSDDSGLKTAFLCSGDSYALNVMRWGSQHGLAIPRDFGLMGFDNINVLDFILPKLTTVSTNLEGVAATAVSELLQQIDSADEYSPKSIYLKYKVLDRDTL